MYADLNRGQRGDLSISNIGPGEDELVPPIWPSKDVR